MGSRQGAWQLYADYDQLDYVQETLSHIAREDLNVAKRDLRDGAKTIAEKQLIPALKMGAYSSGVPIAPAMADTARAKRDRVVTVRIGAVNPKLSGFKRGRGSKRGNRGPGQSQKTFSQSQRTSLAFGSDRGPHPSNPRNPYGIPRQKSAWVLGTIRANGTWQSVVEAYDALLDRLIRDYGAHR